MSDSVYHQGKAALKGGSRLGAYATKVVPNKSFHSYTAEQQATIVEHYFAYPPMRKDPAYQKLIAEVRRSRPMAANVRRRIVLEEIVHGPGQATRRIPRGSRQFMVRGAAAVPLLRLEF